MEEIDDALVLELAARQPDDEQGDTRRSLQPDARVGGDPARPVARTLLVEPLRQRGPTRRRHATEDENERVCELLLEIEEHRCIGEVGMGADQAERLVVPEAVASEEARDLCGGALLRLPPVDARGRHFPAHNPRDVIVDCAVYENGHRRPGELALEEAYEAGAHHGAFVWIGLHEPTEEEFESVRREFDLHELAVEDAIDAHQRPKLEVYGDSLFVVLKTARYVESEQAVEFGEVQLFIGVDFIVTVRHGEAALHDVRLRTEQRPDLLRCGPGAALYAIVDRIVDDYQPVITGLDRDIRAIEGEVFSPSRSNPAERIYTLKREVLELHDAVAPLADPLNGLARGRHELIHEDVRPYFRDVHDHLLNVLAEVASFRDLLTSVLTANLTQVSVRQNEDVRRISAWAAIIAVPTAIAGLYGMNFENMPELGWSLGYPIVLGAIVVVCVSLYTYFRRIGWL